MFQVSILSWTNAAKTVLSFFLALKWKKGTVLHVLKSTVDNLFWTKEGSCSGKVLMTFCSHDGLGRGGFFHAILAKMCPNSSTFSMCQKNLCSCYAEITWSLTFNCSKGVVSSWGSLYTKCLSVCAVSTAAFSKWAVPWPSTWKSVFRRELD